MQNKAECKHLYRVIGIGGSGANLRGFLRVLKKSLVNIMKWSVDN